MTRIITYGPISLLMLFLPAFQCRGDETPSIPSPIETVLIPGAAFTMGTPFKKGDEQYNDNERPLEVSVKDFKIGKNPITAEQMCMFLNSEEAKKFDRETLFKQTDLGGYKTSTIELSGDGRYVPRKNAAKSPALATWKGAVLFCSWLSDKTGKKYRLSSEAEWELAAGGKEKREWPWGNEAPNPKMGPMPDSWNRSTKDLVIKGLSSAASPRTDAYWETLAVGSYPANATPEGVEDFFAYYMNEWCANKYFVHPSAEQATDTHADIDDLRSARTVRGYPHHDYERKNAKWYIRGTEYGYIRYPGRAWNRAGFSLQVKKDYAYAGFRVVEEVNANTP